LSAGSPGEETTEERRSTVASQLAARQEWISSGRGDTFSFARAAARQAAAAASTNLRRGRPPRKVLVADEKFGPGFSGKPGTFAEGKASGAR